MCNMSKNLDDFNKRVKSIDGHRNQCKKCLYKKRKEKYSSQSDEKKEIIRSSINERNRNYRKLKGLIPEFKIIQKSKKRQYHINRLKNDPLYKIRISYTRRLNKYVKKLKIKDVEFLNNLGCTLEELKIHIESKFEHWMNWENYGKYNGELNFGWDIDHIIPLSQSKNEDEFFNLCHYTNLQPLCSKVNRDIKKNKIKNPQ